MRNKTIELTMQSGVKFYVSTEIMNSFGVPDNPVSFVGSYILGTRGPMMPVKTAADATGEDRHINPKQIESMKVTYLD